MPIKVKDADGIDQIIATPNANGRASAANSKPVVLSTEDLAALTALATGLTNIVTAIEGETYYPATQPVSASSLPLPAGAATSAAQATLVGHVDGIETLLGTLGTQTTLAAILAKIIAAPATESKQDSTIAAINGLAGPEYETVAASQTNQTLGATGATGDLLTGVLVIPASTSPGAIAIKDGGNTAINVFAGGASSISSLHPFFIPLGARSGAGAWQLTTGANVSAIAVGNFT